jgi:hypothetical protein
MSQRSSATSPSTSSSLELVSRRAVGVLTNASRYHHTGNSLYHTKAFRCTSYSIATRNQPDRPCVRRRSLMYDGAAQAIGQCVSSIINLHVPWFVCLQSIGPSLRDCVSDSLLRPHKVLKCSCCRRSSTGIPTLPHVSQLYVACSAQVRCSVD